MIALVLYTA